jgi:hypothetical protein
MSSLFDFLGSQVTSIASSIFGNGAYQGDLVTTPVYDGTGTEMDGPFITDKAGVTGTGTATSAIGSAWGILSAVTGAAASAASAGAARSSSTTTTRTNPTKQADNPFQGFNTPSKSKTPTTPAATVGAANVTDPWTKIFSGGNG